MKSRRDVILLIHSSRFSQPRARADGLPLGILHVAGGLIARGIQTRIADLNLDQFDRSHVADVGAVGISCTSYSIGTAIKAARQIREYDPSIPIIWGGVHPSLDPAGTLSHSLVDAVLLGEGDLAFAEACEHLLNGGSVSDAPHLMTSASQASRVCTVDDLDKIPPLPYQLLQLDRYNGGVLDVHSARGCPFTCTFCYNQNKDYRSKSPERIFDDISRGLELFRPGILVFCEDMFFSKFSKVADVCEMLIKKNVNLPWTANCRVEHILAFDQDFWNLLRRSQCSLLKVGIESGSPKMQSLMGKGNIDREMTLQAVELCRKNGIGLKMNYIVGFPTETIDDLTATHKLITDCVKIDPALKRIAIGVYDPYPNTSLWPIALRHGYDAPSNLDEWGRWKGEITRMRWLTDQHKAAIRNLLFLAMVFDEPYINSIDGLWCRQPRARTTIQRLIWRMVKAAIKKDFEIRGRFNAIRYVPERFLYERVYSPIGTTSAPQPGMD